MRRTLGWSSLALLVAVSGCSTVRSVTGGGSPTVDESRLAGVPAEQLAPVQQARQELVQAEQQVEQARQQQEQTKQQKELAQSQLKTSEAELEQAETLQQMPGGSSGGSTSGGSSSVGQGSSNQGLAQGGDADADQPGTQDFPGGEDERTGYGSGATGQGTTGQGTAGSTGSATGSAKPPSMQEAQARVNADKAMVEYMDELDKVRSREVALAEANVDHAKAKLEMAKFQVASRSGRPAPEKGKEKEPTAADFQKAVADAQAKVAQRRTDLLQAQTAAAQKYEAWTSLDRALPGGTRQRVQVPPPPRG